MVNNLQGSQANVKTNTRTIQKQKQNPKESIKGFISIQIVKEIGDSDN